MPLRPAGEGGPPLPHGGLLRRVFGVGLALLATVLVVAGIVEGTPEAVVTGSIMGATGTGSFWWGLRALNERRKALMQRLQQRVLQLARHHGGTLTVENLSDEPGVTFTISLPITSLDEGPEAVA